MSENFLNIIDGICTGKCQGNLTYNDSTISICCSDAQCYIDAGFSVTGCNDSLERFPRTTNCLNGIEIKGTCYTTAPCEEGFSEKTVFTSEEIEICVPECEKNFYYNMETLNCEFLGCPSGYINIDENCRKKINCLNRQTCPEGQIKDVYLNGELNECYCKPIESE